ncbi:non-ribosomal peptide synthetase [Flavobacterium pectinovorum]|uniref:Amino acid adenylation domain-containing protein n=1 Tax=Flavobacterium pectinovorum TaxID=29533 RepID=A0A502EI24_9FLAO|nr:non-ribosomal peptide synthetase [Flavobacterium pectinovorum]TPG36146.1 amino acid adenylation domain-containing protein [Flavobacterium pectinovorum]
MNASNQNHEVYGSQQSSAPTHLTEQEKNHLLYTFNDTGALNADYLTLPDLFRETVHKYKNNRAIVCGNDSITYQQLDEQSNKVANYLMSIGISTGSLVPVQLDRSIELIISILGILKSGAAYIPIDYSLPLKRVSYIIADSNAKIIITDNANKDLIAKEVSCISLSDAVVQEQSIEPLSVTISRDDLAYIIYTSGSTGNPKGVMVAHQSIQHLIIWHNKHFNVTSNSSLSFVAGSGFDIAVWEIWSSLVAGSVLYIADNDERINATQLLDYYGRNKITHGFAPTVLVPDIVKESQQKKLSLIYLFTAGEKLKPVNTQGLPYTLVDYYGPTECTVYATFYMVNRTDGLYVSSIGKPIANTQAYVLSPQLDLLPIGAVGELCISGACLSKGYWGQPELTNQKFIAHPFKPGEKLYKTGDLVRWLDDGNIEYIGRIDNQVKIRGYRIELGEIENALVGIPNVSKAVVIAKENNKLYKTLVAFIVLDKKINKMHEPTSTNAIRQHLKQELPGYMIPAHFILTEEMPMNANGKTDLNRLHELPLQHDANNGIITAPETEAEEIITSVWADLLERTEIDTTDNFFDIGGDSLLVAVAVTDITSKMNVKAYMRDLYQYPTIQSLAAILTERKIAVADIPEEDAEPVIELQKDVYLSQDTVITGSFDTNKLINPAHIFLTGVTGFIGINLVEELLTKTNAAIYCLIRAKNEYDALLKINELLDKFHISISEELKKRIVPVIGDLTKKNLGLPDKQFDMLADSIDVIYHSASSVNFIQPYSYMKATNVDGLREIVYFAAHNKLKCLVLLSTISVYSWGHVFTSKTVMTEQDDIKQNILAISKDIGYVRSKYVMEEIADLAASKGLPVITYRLGYAMCHGTSGASAPYQWWAGLVKLCLKHNTYPALTELREGLITVDYMVKSMVHISKNPDAIGLKFNLIASPETNLTLDQFFQLLHKYYPLQLNKLPYKEWRKLWEDNSSCELYPLTSLFKDNMHEGLSTVELYQDTYIWDNTQVKTFLEGSDIKEPIFDKKVLDAYLLYLGISFS